ncbi:O-antigen polymerase [Rhodococcoides fascians]|uniref:Oligosaccharide repeat unit polymerase n=1 Tax=Rhodococcoides fascians TaxID=1828 RepID=A0A143QM24_RHOFA|nr:O-antigen polymerase [Rhodococcus fascians]AMY23427.1 hypothetical protein A3Q41_02125 [Rhodococcus fascians]OZC38955.1 oligosaccharide repeat unit polymerase [Rhodococcus fascians]
MSSPIHTASAPKRDRWQVLVFGGCSVAIAAGAVGYLSGSLVSFQYAISLIAVVVAAQTDQSFRVLPLLMRPAVPVMIAAVISAIYANTLTAEDYSQYITIWTLQIVGFVIALFTPIPNSAISYQSRQINSQSLTAYARALFWLAILSFLAFITLKGIPALGSDIEQGRVDAATSGTGYIRLMAYMSVPSALVLVALKARRHWLYVVAAAIVILAMGNRSPLLYLLVPLLFLYPMKSDKRVSSIPLIGFIVLISIGIVGIGTYRVVSQDSFRSYSEYRIELAQGDYLGIAGTTFEHYAGVVPANAVLAKSLIDEGKLDYQFGTTYLTLFVTAIPGEQPSLDQTIKRLSNRDFVGGGTPPTLMGEGYINGGYPGVVLGSVLVMWLARVFAARTTTDSLADLHTKRIHRILYGYMLTWAATCQVAGLTGASTVPLAGFLALTVLTLIAKGPMNRDGETNDKRHSLVRGSGKRSA